MTDKKPAAAARPDERGYDAKTNDRMVTTLFLAAVFHSIVILGVSFGAGAGSDPDKLPTLEVLLVNSDLPQAFSNPEADYLAQRTQQGSGNTQDARRTSSPPSSLASMDNPGVTQGEGLENREAGQQRSAPAVLAGLGAATQVVHLADVTDLNQGPSQAALLMHAGPVSPLPSNDISSQLVLRGRQKGELLVTPNTRESDVSVYLDAWRRKVERIGTIHFPQEVRRQGLAGSPVLEVAIRSNGVLEDIIVRRTSGYAQLDQAALSILKLSTPFDPFPTEVAKRHKVLRFAYEWQFLGGEMVDSSVRAPAGQ